MSEISELLTIGEVARESGKATSAIRYYEEIGLLPAPRRVAGRRRYGRDVIRTLAVIETAQRGGLTLDEIRLLLEASPDNGVATDRLRDVAERKLPELTALIERAELVRGWLEDAARCVCPTLADCPLFEPARLPDHTQAAIGTRRPSRPAPTAAAPSPPAAPGRGRSKRATRLP